MRYSCALFRGGNYFGEDFHLLCTDWDIAEERVIIFSVCQVNGGGSLLTKIQTPPAAMGGVLHYATGCIIVANIIPGENCFLLEGVSQMTYCKAVLALLGSL